MVVVGNDSTPDAPPLAQRRGDVNIQMGVDSTRDRTRRSYDGHSHPFSVSRDQGVARTSREGDRDERTARWQPFFELAGSCQVDAMLVRPAELRDVEVLKALRHAAFAKHAPSAYSPEEVENLLNDLDEEELVLMITERQMFVGEVDGVLVGCAGWRGANLRHVYVRPGRERAGVGTRLVAWPSPTTRSDLSGGDASRLRGVRETLLRGTRLQAGEPRPGLGRKRVAAYDQVAGSRRVGCESSRLTSDTDPFCPWDIIGP